MAFRSFARAAPSQAGSSSVTDLDLAAAASLQHYQLRIRRRGETLSFTPGVSRVGLKIVLTRQNQHLPRASGQVDGTFPRNRFWQTGVPRAL